ncbi:nickel-dependent hydrogenase large subunit [Dethiobacter alkaliphilus]|uniref:Nickel-dependent hydrogenase large subunit n=1 Tax=Dethiobacter alkaliphilus AHT 1 TaxID=555088 RepID=C0GFF9_DETAL|nr:nickel-dependent hydrogenase large subunit [Dethiobacter alkaliphilus]EEG77919.1 nickel-dependent hydrogenase large subunit [Dethiobacter alkaliphilus AHT 1]
MPSKITLGPITRAQNSCSVEVSIENGAVVDARCGVDFFRGFELILKGRDPRDAGYLSQRICGICSAAHGTAAAMALEDAAQIRPPRNGALLRNLILGADFMQDHFRHFYIYGLPDYVEGPDMGPFAPGYTKGFRLSKKKNDLLMKHYQQALDIARLNHEMVTLLAGKAPHNQGLLAGGCTVPPAADILADFQSKLKKVRAFIKDVMMTDMMILAETYSDYYHIGTRAADFLEFGLFTHPENNQKRYFPSGALIHGQNKEVNSNLIAEHLRNSWYDEEAGAQHPAQGKTIPNREKSGAYSWVKAPRYDGKSVEGGPLARLWIKGDYQRGVSVMDRNMARVLETEKIADLMVQWLAELEPGKPVFKSFKMPSKAEGIGLTGAMRGPLGHWLKIEKGRIAHYQIITPTAWNFSPRDASGQLGPVEEALIGTTIEDEKEPVEIGRVIRSFDICSACASH